MDKGGSKDTIESDERKSSGEESRERNGDAIPYTSSSFHEQLIPLVLGKLQLPNGKADLIGVILVGCWLWGSATPGISTCFRC